MTFALVLILAAAPAGTDLDALNALRRETGDTARPLEQRLQSALQGATLSPDDPEWSALVARLFFEHQLALVPGDGAPKYRRTFTHECGPGDASDCFRVPAFGNLKDTLGRVETAGRSFVVAYGHGEEITVLRGTFRIDQARVLRGEVLGRTRIPSTPVLRRALFPGARFEITGRQGWAYRPFGQGALSDASQALLDAMPGEWGLVMTTEEPGFYDMPIHGCRREPYRLRFWSYLHGVSGVTVEGRTEEYSARTYFIESVRADGGELSLELVDERGERSLRRFRPPAAGDNIATFDGTPYSSDLRMYARRVDPCVGEGGP